MVVAWFDPDGSRAAAASWASWSRQLDIGGKALRLQLDALVLDRWSGGATRLEDASDELRTLGAFTRRVGRAVELADGSVPTTATGTAAMWTDVARMAAIGEGVRESGSAEAARVRWLRTLAPHDLRAHLEAELGDDPFGVLARLDGASAVLYWEALDDDQRAAVATARPDLAALAVLANGGSLDPALLERVDRSNAFGEFSQTFAAEIGVSITTRVVSVELGGGVALVMTKMSDDSVEMTLVEGGHVGAGLDLDVPGAANATATLGVVGELRQRFRFADERMAAEAVHLLRAAAREDASLGELAKDVGGMFWNSAVAGHNLGVRLGNWAVPGADPFPEIPTYDLTPETVRELQALWADHGVTKQEGAGVVAAASAEFEVAAGIIEAELGAEAEARLMFYDTDVAPADTTGAVGQTGVLLSGAVSIDAELATSGIGRDTGDHVAVGAGYLLDLHHVDGAGTYLTVTLQTDVAAGTALELLDLRAAELDATSDRTAAMTLVITVPVDASTTNAVGRVGAHLARGSLPAEALRELHDAAEIDVTVATGTSSVAELELDGGVVEVTGSVTVTSDATRVALHKYPSGELFSRIEVDRLVDEARLVD